MRFNTYGGAAAAMAADLVNLGRGGTFDREQVAAVINRHAPTLPEPGGPEAARIMQWTQQLDAAFGEMSQQRRVDVINALLQQAASRPMISTHDNQPPHLHYHGEGEGVVNRVRAVTATGLAYVLCDEGGHRLGRCADDRCAVVFIDISKGGNRQFCTTRCANRVNAVRHRARQRAMAMAG
ncbi:CGNR zinc finger domain-containing protein [Actinokineospora globicatena]|uniref:Zinc finger CGNR domain-containing protein n=1 Tax=Actinokineospora globicatena TaxID=103729 RepID=A0A9W6QHE4_9PSEU|nr:CGNR zinc finger domain-containing protein [Actinokineospora globicatena]MCP2306471.1 CGNR zinc finger domain-containing protein [Actinokineospora globicatena]GLW81900.1 hypothetical protein Aglo01_63810 [Actinokineospora globicatena]GLW88694.1 hypothetical protein Aglo02_63330 [Actinokineospora globicatena]GLW89427.1 hypothetical protein Aglo03_02430 [Actinokineospora globicatena]